MSMENRSYNSGDNAVFSNLEELFITYRKAIAIYFSIDDFTDVEHFMSLIKNKNLNEDQEMFLEWLRDEGFPYLENLENQVLPDSEKLAKQINYQKRSIDKEIQYNQHDELRACLIDIVADMPERIDLAREELAAFIDSSSTPVNSRSMTTETMIGTWIDFENEYLDQFLPTGEELTFFVSNIDESSINVDSSFLF